MAQIPAEVTIIVFKAQGLLIKKKKQHKYTVNFGIGDNKAKSDHVDSPDGNPEWNTEAQLNITNPLEALVIKVKDKDDILGQVTLHMHELPTTRSFRPRKVPLRAHKKCPNATGEISFEAWISKTRDGDIPQTTTSHERRGSLSLLKALHGHSDPASQKANSPAFKKSTESLNSTISAQSSISEASKKKKSAFKKLKDTFKAPPPVQSSKLTDGIVSQSCVDLTMRQPTLVHHGGSRESLQSQESDLISQTSGGEKKKSRNPFKKLKDKVTHSGGKDFKLNKKSSQSMSDLAFGGSPLSRKEAHSSSESLEIKAQSSMGKGFPEKFDLTIPKTLLNMSVSEEEPSTIVDVPVVIVEEEGSAKKIPGHKRTLSDTPSWKNSPEHSPRPEQKRRVTNPVRSLNDKPPLPPSKQDNDGDDKKYSLFARDAFGRGSNSSTKSDSSGAFKYAVPYEAQTEPPKQPEISGVSPSQATTEGGTRLTIRGERLGNNKDDIIRLSVCGTNCLPSLEYISDYKIHCTTTPCHAGPGKIIIETESGGRGVSLVDFVFFQQVRHEPETKEDMKTVTDVKEKANRNQPEFSSPHDRNRHLFTSPWKLDSKKSPESKKASDDKADVAKIPVKPPRQNKSDSSKNSPTEENSPTGMNGASELDEPSNPFSDYSATPSPEFETISKTTQGYNVAATQNTVKSDGRLQTNIEHVQQKVNSESDTKRKIIPEGIEREEPEGMSVSKDSPDPKLHHVRSNHQQAFPATVDDSSSAVLGLKAKIQELEMENKNLKEANENLTAYLHKVIEQVVEKCPELLCIDKPILSSPLKHKTIA